MTPARGFTVSSLFSLYLDDSSIRVAGGYCEITIVGRRCARRIYSAALPFFLSSVSYNGKISNKTLIPYPTLMRCRHFEAAGAACSSRIFPRVRYIAPRFFMVRACLRKPSVITITPAKFSIYFPYLIFMSFTKLLFVKLKKRF